MISTGTTIISVVIALWSNMSTGANRSRFESSTGIVMDAYNVRIHCIYFHFYGSGSCYY